MELPVDKIEFILRFIESVKNLIWKVTTYDANSGRKSQSVFSDFKLIGNGSFGLVFLAKDISNAGKKVAIKIIYQDKRFKNRELEIMRRLSHEHIVKLYKYFFKIDNRTNDVYLNLVLEYVSDTLSNWTRIYVNRDEKIQESRIKIVVFHMLKSLHYIHERDICHRDIKPQNLLLVPERGIVKLCDFGSAKIMTENNASVSYICSRYYRAPELLLGSTSYGIAIDMWSAGCVMAELLLGFPLFQGSCNKNQMEKIVSIMGDPSKEELADMNVKEYSGSVKNHSKDVFRMLFKKRSSPEFVEILTKMLEYSPKKGYRQRRQWNVNIFQM